MRKPKDEFNGYLKLFISILIVYLNQMNQINALDNNHHQAKYYCGIKNVNYIADYLAEESYFREYIGFKSDIKYSDFTLDNDSYNVIENNIKEYQNKIKKLEMIEINWPAGNKQTSSLTRQFNLTAFLHLFNFNFHQKYLLK